MTGGAPGDLHRWIALSALLIRVNDATLHACLPKALRPRLPAVASAFAYLCDPGPFLDLVVLEEWFEEAEAHAFAEVRTHGLLLLADIICVLCSGPCVSTALP